MSSAAGAVILLRADQCTTEALLMSLRVEELCTRPGQLRAELAHLLLELADGAGAPEDGIPDPGGRLVHDAAHRVRPLALRQLLIDPTVKSREDRLALA